MEIGLREGCSVVTVRTSFVGSGVPRSLRCVLARARQCLLGGYLRSNFVPAAARGFAAQGLVPDDRHRDRRHNDRGADCVLPTGSHCLSGAACLLVRSLRFRRHGAPQLRILLGGGASSDVFLLAVTRASEICIGIACAGIVLAGTDLGGAQRRLAESFANLAAEIMGRFGRMLALAEAQLPDTKAERREFVRRIIALDPVIDQALGESSHLRHHSSNLQTAMYGLFAALDGWRGVAAHLSRLPEAARRQGASIILRSLPSALRPVPEAAAFAKRRYRR